ncbi:MAG: hypothetical protein ACYDCO_11805 [Armatimonadota bacterium]
MKRYALTAALLGLLALASMAGAQMPGPDLAELSNVAFGWVSMSGADPTLEMLTSFAPTSMALRDAGYRTGGEAVTGGFQFGDLDVNSTFGSAMTSAGPGLLRICEYKYDSNLANIAGLPGMPARTDGEAIEISYAQHVGRNTTIGVSLVPQDTSTVTMVMGGQSMVESETKTDYGLRGGAVIRLPGETKVGINYSYQHDKGKTRVSPLLTGAPDWIETEGTFHTRCATVGLSKQVTPKTLVYGAYQNINVSGLSTGTRKSDQVRVGVQHHITDNFAVRANYADGGQNYSIMYKSPIGIVNVAYTSKALYDARDILGTGNAAFVSLAMAF